MTDDVGGGGKALMGLPLRKDFFAASLREDTHKKFFFSGWTYTNGLVVHAIFLSYNSLKRILTSFFVFLQFLG